MTKIICPTCNGRGRYDDYECGTCDATGWIDANVSAYKVFTKSNAQLLFVIFVFGSAILLAALMIMDSGFLK